MKVNLIKRSKVVKAKDNAALVTWLRKHDSEKLETNADFMNAYSKRKELYDNISLRCSDEDVFVEDLLKNGYIKIIK